MAKPAIRHFFQAAQKKVAKLAKPALPLLPPFFQQVSKNVAAYQKPALPAFFVRVSKKCHRTRLGHPSSHAVPKVAASKKVQSTAAKTAPTHPQNSRRNCPRRTNRHSAITPVMPIAAPWQVGYKVEKFNPLNNNQKPEEH